MGMFGTRGWLSVPWCNYFHWRSWKSMVDLMAGWKGDWKGDWMADWMADLKEYWMADLSKGLMKSWMVEVR